MCAIKDLYEEHLIQGFRGTFEVLGDVRRVLGLGTVPDHSTLNRVSAKQIHRLLEKVLELVASEVSRAILFACDSTGFKEDIASFYYALRREGGGG